MGQSRSGPRVFVAMRVERMQQHRAVGDFAHLGLETAQALDLAGNEVQAQRLRELNHVSVRLQCEPRTVDQVRIAALGARTRFFRGPMRGPNAQLHPSHRAVSSGAVGRQLIEARGEAGQQSRDAPRVRSIERSGRAVSRLALPPLEGLQELLGLRKSRQEHAHAALNDLQVTQPPARSERLAEVQFQSSSAGARINEPEQFAHRKQAARSDPHRMHRCAARALAGGD